MSRIRETCAAWMDVTLPFIAMLMITFLDVSIAILVKAAMNSGLESIVYCVYHNALATLVLFPFFIFHIFRNVGRLPLTLHILFRFFILGLLGLCLYEILAYQGIDYSSPTMASAISNLAPGITFLLAVGFRSVCGLFGDTNRKNRRMEKIDIRTSSSGAKLLGTIIALSGAMVLTFYQGPEIFHSILPPDSPNQLLSSQSSNWIFGGLLIFVAVTCGSLWNVSQTKTDKEYPDQQTIVFFMCLFGTIQCMAVAPFMEPSPSVWVLRTRIELIAVVSGAVHSTMLRCTVVIWCLRKKGPIYVVMFSPLSIVISVIMGITFLGDSLYLGSAIGATIVTVGFYIVMWGQAKEENKLSVVLEGDLGVADETGLSDQTTPLLISRNE